MPFERILLQITTNKTAADDSKVNYKERKESNELLILECNYIWSLYGVCLLVIHSSDPTRRQNRIAAVENMNLSWYSLILGRCHKFP